MQYRVKIFIGSNTITAMTTSCKAASIQVYTHTTAQKSVLCLDENAIVFLVTGKLKIGYGPVEDQVTENQLAFLKKNILIDYETEPDEALAKLNTSFA